MAIRKTESRIPKGFRAEDLGEAKIEKKSISIGDRNIEIAFSLVSNLTSPITIGRKIEYVLFVENVPPEQWENWRFAWKTTHIKSSAIISSAERTEKSVYSTISMHEGMIRTEVKVYYSDADEPQATLQLEQEIVPTYSALDRLIRHSELFDKDERYNISIAGNGEATREFFYEYLDYVNRSIQSLNNAQNRDAFNVSVPRIMLASIIYYCILRKPREERKTFLSELINLANEESFTKSETPVGVSQLSMLFAAMIIKKPDDTVNESYINFRDLPDVSGFLGLNKSRCLKELRSDFEELTPQIKIDLLNILRFPKSNIDCCFKLLNRLKNRHNRYPEMSTANFESNQAANEVITDELINGPSIFTNNQYKLISNSSKIFYYRFLPFFNLGLDGKYNFVISGTVEDEMNPTTNMQGARIFLYKTMLVNITNNLRCFKSMEMIRNGDEPIYEELEFHEETEDTPEYAEILPVLDVIRNPEGFPQGTCIAKVQKRSYKFDNDEGYVRYRTGTTIHAKLTSERIGENRPFGYVEDDNTFILPVRVMQPYFIRVVKDPDPETHIGYFDGELNDISDGLPRGWFWRLGESMSIQMQPIKYPVRESDFIELLMDWKKYKYERGVPQFPLGYKLRDLDRHNDTLPGIRTGRVRRIVCNPFVQALITQAWHNHYGRRLYWTWSHNRRSNNNDYNEAEESGTHPFSAAYLYSREMIINIIGNPLNDFFLTIGYNGSVSSPISVNQGSNRNATVNNIISTLENVINSIADHISTISGPSNITVFRNNGPVNNRNYSYIVLSVNPPLNPDLFDVAFHYESADSTCSEVPEIVVSPKCFQAIDVHAAVDGNNPPPQWSVVQGWRRYNKNPPQDLGHNFFVVDTNCIACGTSPIYSVLTLESNYPARLNLNGPGFRRMGKVKIDNGRTQVKREKDSGNIDKHEMTGSSEAHIISPNKELHWSEKVDTRWSNLWSHYIAYNATIGVVRLKLYDLNWTKPIL